MNRKQEKRKPLGTQAADTPGESRGRPKGASHDTDVVTASVTRCKKCGSEKRRAYSNIRKKPIAGVTLAGVAYNWVVWKHTVCKACGQHRDDKFFMAELPDGMSGPAKD